MLFGTAVATALLAASAVSATSSSSEVQVQVVQVSNASGALEYFPNNIQAAVGSLVQFQFWPKNHTASQSSFADPCTPLLESTPNATSAFKSGFMPVSTNDTEIPVFTIQINDTTPIWVYCAQTGHCAKGMVMAINAENNSSKNFAAFQANALATASNSSSSSSTSSSGSSTTSSSSSATSAASSSTSSTATTNGASRPVAGLAGLALLLVAGVAAVL